MKYSKGKFTLSASDLSNFLSCNHLTSLDLSLGYGNREKPVWNNPHTEVLQERGFEHEDAYIEHLKSQDKKVVTISEEAGEDAYQKTVDAMKSGAEVIIQGTLRYEQWYGRSDVLLRVEEASELGEYSYEVVDTKLSRETKASAILQLCLYSELVSIIQGKMPEHMAIVIPGNDYEPLQYRVDDYMAYYRLVRENLLKAINSFDKEEDVVTYPEPTGHCDLCSWWADCDKRRRDDDHLGFIAGINSRQIKELKANNISTMKTFAELEEGFEKNLNDSSPGAYQKVHGQAKIQIKGREQGKDLYEFLEAEKGRGFNKLPKPSEGDIFFDIEGDTFVGDNGLEYLLGVSFIEDGKLEYVYKWALSYEEEKAAFEWFMDLVAERLKQYPDMHIYHYAPYEPGAIKRLMGKYGSREREVDSLLRAEKFVDLYSVVRQSIRASVEKYSIKDLESFYGYERKIALGSMAYDKRALEHALELNNTDRITDKMKESVKVYNQDDTDSTYYLREWLEKLRLEAIKTGMELSRPEEKSGEANENVSELEEKITELKLKLQEGLPAAVEERDNKQQALWLLSELTSFFVRENKVAYWEKFRLMEMDAFELKEERSGLSELKCIGEVGGTKRCPIHRYKFSEQEVDFKAGDDIYNAGGNKIGKLEAIDRESGTIDIKKRTDTADFHPYAVFKSNIIDGKELTASLIRFASYIVEHPDDFGPYKAAMEILYRSAPRLSERTLKINGAKLSEIKRIVSHLDSSYLPIQGPPGAGKSFTGKHVIADLISLGKKVGITAMSHKVIAGLMESAVDELKNQGIECRVIKKGGASEAPKYEEESNPSKVADAILSEDRIVVGGTSWLFCREDLVGELDYLIVDEAGQLSLANLMSIGASAKNILLLGDPQQLEQPIQGTHPDGCAVSALEHILGDQQTVSEDRGIFLDNTYRLHPDICSFNSELFYEGRLDSVSGNEAQIIEGTTKFAKNALWYVNVDHYGNQNSSVEEVEKVKEIINELVDGTNTYTLSDNGKLTTKTLTLEDIMVVAPYNAQVQMLKEEIPGLEVGTVDKFQGRKAPVVIYSMTTSSPEDAPRGMEFLYSLNRLNVAVSRAQCSFILLANSKIFEPECKSPRQMQLANALCRYLEIAVKV